MILTGLTLIPFYLIGSFPTGKLVAHQSGVDLTKTGSGNVGATNVARVVGKKAGIITLLGDVAKGALAVTIASLCTQDPWFPSLAGMAVVTGHCFSIPGYLKGGKGVASALGVVLTLTPLIALLTLATFAVVFYAKRIVSLASIVACAAAAIFALCSGSPEPQAAALSYISLLVIARHHQNISRLIQGTEPQFLKKRD
jgi:glycerol-3-phosphate acyltransferase PlsY